MSTFTGILCIVYWIAGYWAVGETILANKIIFYEFGKLFLFKLIVGAALGWLLIPIAIIKNALS